MARLVYAFNYLLCVVFGAFVGFFIGGVLWTLTLESLLPASWESAIRESGHADATTALMSFGFAGYSISRFLRAYETYQNMLELKRLHRLVYFPIRHWFQETVNVVQGAIWAGSYICTETFLPPLVAISACLFVWSVMGTYLSGSPWFYWIPVVILCYFGSLYIHQMVTDFVYHLYHPKRLEQELKDAPANMAVLRTRQEEERVRQDGLNEGDQNSLPGRRGK